MCKAPSKTKDTDEDLKPINNEVIDLLVNNHRRFSRFLERRVESKAVAEDILQDAFVKTLEKGNDIKPDEGAITWFYRLLRNAVIDHYRRKDVEKRGHEREAREASFPVEMPTEVRDAICACMTDLLPTLKDDYAEMIQKIDLEGASITAVAESNHQTKNNTMVKLHRARQALKRQLERSCGTCAEHGCLDCTCKKSSS